MITHVTHRQGEASTFDSLSEAMEEARQIFALGLSPSVIVVQCNAGTVRLRSFHDLPSPAHAFAADLAAPVRTRYGTHRGGVEMFDRGVDR